MYVCQSVSKLLSAGSDRCVPDCQGVPRLKSHFFSFLPKPSPSPLKLRLQGEAAVVREWYTRWGEKVMGVGGCHRLSRSDRGRGERLYTSQRHPLQSATSSFTPARAAQWGRAGWGAIGPREKWLPLRAWPPQTLTPSPSPPSTDFTFSASHAERPLWPPPIGAFRLAMTTRTVANGREAPPPTVF